MKTKLEKAKRPNRRQGSQKRAQQQKGSDWAVIVLHGSGAHFKKKYANGLDETQGPRSRGTNNNSLNSVAVRVPYNISLTGICYVHPEVWGGGHLLVAPN